MVTDITNTQLSISGLSGAYTITATPQGHNYTSTATVSSNTITFTLPTAVTTESWTIEVDPSAAPTDNFVVKLKRYT